MSRIAVLVFSSDPMAAALLGAAMDLAGYTPHFAAANERARSAMKRVRPALVLIDCDHEESCSEEFIGPALMMNAKVLLFRTHATKHDVADLVKRMSLGVVNLPRDQDVLIEQLRGLSA